jgi:uncharacterized RDD family membrane protein YckC
MDWYYSDNGKQAGPVSDEALQQLVRSGSIRPETIVWHSGLSAWTPYAKVPGVTMPAPAAPAAPAPGVPTSYCTECGRAFPVDDLARFGDRWVCGHCKELFAQKLREGVAPQGAAQYAGFWVRVGATFIDGLIVGGVFGIVALVIVLAMLPSLTRQAGAPSLALAGPMMAFFGIFELLALAGAASYEAFFVSRSGATPGKKVLHLKVVMPDGGRVSLGRAFGRYFAKMLSGMILYLGYIMVAFDSEKRGLHDYICGTRVIRTS